MKLNFGNGFSLSLWQDEVKTLEVQNGQIILTTPSGHVITLKIPNIDPQDHGVSGPKVLKTSLPSQEGTEPQSPTNSTSSTACSETLDTSVTRDANMDMIESLRREVERFKQDVTERYQQIRNTHDSLGVRQKRVEEGNTDTKTKLNMFEELMRVVEARVTVQEENLTALADGITDVVESSGMGELPSTDARVRKKKAKAK